MPDSRREKLVKAVIARMKLINGAGSYTTALGTTIIDGVSGPSVKDSETNWAQDQGTLPAISVFDGDADATPSSAGDPRSTFHVMPILIKAFCEQGTTAAAARTMIKDIMTAIRQDTKWTVSGTKLAMQTRQVTDRVARNKDSFEVEGSEVEIAVQFQTDKFNAE